MTSVMITLKILSKHTKSIAIEWNEANSVSYNIRSLNLFTKFDP